MQTANPVWEESIYLITWLFISAKHLFFLNMNSISATKGILLFMQENPTLPTRQLTNFPPPLKLLYGWLKWESYTEWLTRWWEKPWRIKGGTKSIDSAFWKACKSETGPLTKNRDYFISPESLPVRANYMQQPTDVFDILTLKDTLSVCINKLGNATLPAPDNSRD